jgi:hypothetical protein
MTDTSIFLPSDWLHRFASNPKLKYEFQAAFGVHRLEEFWDGQDLAHARYHGVRDIPHLRSRCIPLCLHGDGAKFQERDSLMIISFGGLLREGATLDNNFVIATFPKSCTSKRDGGTWDTIWAWIKWDFQALLTNKFPAVDPWGEAFDPDSHRGQVAGQNILPDDMCCWLFGIQGQTD